MSSGPHHGRHIGRSWSGHPLEDECPCPKAACGLAIADGDPDCAEHGIDSGKTLRQVHEANRCPNRNDGITWVDMPDGIHQKGVRVTIDGTHIAAEAYVRVKPGLWSMPDPQAITLPPAPVMRDFGHND